MAWSDPLDLYCERLTAGLWDEPLNAISNIAFAAAAVALFRLHARLRERGDRLSVDIRALPWLVFGVALCSLAFHTLAIRWVGWLDSLSILLYCAVSVYSFLRHATGVGASAAAGAGVAFALASFGASRVAPPGTLNGSLAYLPNLLTLLAVTAFLGVRGAKAFRGFALASFLFGIALMLRTMDLAWCPMLPIGTHFLWHLLAGLLLWVVSVELTLRRFGSDLRKPAYGDPKDWSRGFDRRLQACRDRLTTLR